MMKPCIALDLYLDNVLEDSRGCVHCESYLNIDSNKKVYELGISTQ